jgi:hypothetical protein
VSDEDNEKKIRELIVGEFWKKEKENLWTFFVDWLELFVCCCLFCIQKAIEKVGKKQSS